MMVSLLIRYRWCCFAVLLACVSVGLPFARRAMVPDHALTVWFVDDDPALMAYQDFQAQFGNDEIVVLGYRQERGLLNPAELDKIRRVTAALEQVEGVSRVYSLTNARDVVRAGFGVRVSTLVTDYEAQPRRLAHLLKTSPLVAGRFLNEAGTMTMLWIRLAVMDDVDAKREAILARITDIASSILGKRDVHLGGTGVILTGLNTVSQRDFTLFTGLSYLLILVIIFLLFRRVLLVLLALAVVLVASLLTLELYGLAGKQINMVTAMLPTVITILGIADVIHVLNRYAGLAAGQREDRFERVRRALQAVARPCLYTTLTTAAGFLSLIFTRVAVMRELGLFAAIGIGIAFLATVVLGAILLPVIDPSTYRPRVVQHLACLLNTLLNSLWRHPVRYGIGVAVVLVFSAMGWTHIVVDTYTLGYLPDDHTVTRDHRFLESQWGPYSTVEMTVRPLGDRNLTDPALVQAMVSFSKEATQMEEVSTVFGLHTLLERYSNVWFGDDRILRSQRQIYKAMRLMEALAEEEFYRLVNEDYTRGRITFTGAMMSARDLDRTLRRVEAVARRHFDGLAEVRFAGYPPLYVKIIDYIMEAQIQSFYLALLLVFSLIWLFLRDLKLAFLAMLPNLFPIAVLMGVMGFLGISLDIGTAAVAAVVLGVAIDDTIHLLIHFQEARASLDTHAALEQTLSRVGRSVVVTSVVLVLGFAVLLLAGVKTVFYFGLLTAIAVVGALIGDLVLLPLLLKVAFPDFAIRVAGGVSGAC